jgi:hypothetical protein
MAAIESGIPMTAPGQERKLNGVEVNFRFQLIAVIHA